jgi:hypothetical protein
VIEYRQNTLVAVPRNSRSLLYAYNGTLYTLTRCSSSVIGDVQLGPSRYANVIQSVFETRNHATGVVTRFEVTYGTSGALSEIPVHAVYQPRWWLEVQLFLDDAGNF